MNITLLLLCAFFILLFYYILHYRRFVRLINNIPGYPFVPFLGHAIDLFECSQEDLWKMQRVVAKIYYPICKMWCGPIAIVIIQHPDDIEERVRNEVNTLMQINEEKLTMSALNSMLYLERCLKESLRLYPSVPLISRVLSEDVKMQSYLVPSGTTVILNIHDIHRDCNFWPNPDVFDPDRFLPEKIQNRHPYSYVPFSAGPRNCIGQRFAMLEMKAVMASLVYNFYLESVDYLKDISFMIDMINRVTRPIRVRFVPIKRM